MLNYLGRALICDYSILYEYGGAQTLKLYLSTGNTRYKEIKYEQLIEADGNLYVIKSIDEQQNESTVECVLCQDGLKSKAFEKFETSEKTLSETLAEALLNTGWSLANGSLVTIRRSISLEDCTPLAIVAKCQDTFGIVFDIDAKNKVLTAQKPENVQWAGAYITDQLNLRRTDYKGDTYELITRLYPFGAVSDQDVALDISSVNNGIKYIDNTNYTNKIVCAIWRDERYTDAQSLKDAAIEKLATLAQPLESYELDVVDLAKMGGSELLSIALYDKIMLLDRVRGRKVEHQVVQIEDYPLHREDNVITLSTVVQKIESKISSTIALAENQIKRVSEKVSEIKQDADAIAARVEETYTKGETDNLISGAITISDDRITAEVLSQQNTNDQLKKQLSALEISSTSISGAVQSIIDNGVDKVVTETGATLDADGLHITKSGEEMESRIDYSGLYVERDDVAILTANNVGVETENVTVRTYLVVGDNSRFENYGTNRTGLFYIGGDS